MLTLKTKKKTKKNRKIYIFLNGMKYIEGSFMKSTGKIFREHSKLLVRKKVYFKVKRQNKMRN